MVISPELAWEKITRPGAHPKRPVCRQNVEESRPDRSCSKVIIEPKKEQYVSILDPKKKERKNRNNVYDQQCNYIGDYSNIHMLVWLMSSERMRKWVGVNPPVNWILERGFEYSVIINTYVQIVPKIQSAFGYRLRKNPLWNLKCQTRLWNYDYFVPVFTMWQIE